MRMNAINYTNQLPVNTWNHLKVNQGLLELNIPETIQPYLEDRDQVARSASFLPTSSEREEITQKFLSVFANKDVLSLPEGTESTKQLVNYKNYLLIGENEKYEEPLILSYDLDSTQSYLMKENYIYAKAGSEVTILLNYQSKDNTPATLGVRNYIYVEQNAKVNLHVVQLLNEESSYFEYLNGYLEEGATLDMNQIELGSDKNYVGSEVILAKDNSTYLTNVIYLGSKSQTIDMNFVAKHYGKHSVSKIIGKGSLDDQSKKIFRATIDFKQGCSNASGEESEETLLLSQKVKNKSVPLILCGEDNVSGAHAASIGRLNESQLFYLMARGLTALEAKQLLILSRFEGIYKNIPDTKIKEEIESYIKRSIYHENNNSI